ncbi:MAG: C4-dicarboxylate ABC transporter [Lysobacterales bacterium CG02_land_8_20_14_3_00_62_12]|nr:MAG: C4-dicarboxylate ABC transporter [Xanthomonadales bacterium CG02_land_8_20_14_3_00_62_12]
MFNKLMMVALLVAAGAVDADVLKLATVAPEGTSWMKEMRAAGERVKQRTEARVEIKFFPGGVMGNDIAVLRKIKLGQLQGGAFSGAELSPVFASAQIYSLPFLFADLAEVAAVRVQVDPLIQAGLQQAGMVAVGMSGGGFAYLMSTQPILNKAELMATKVWVMQNDRIAQVAFAEAGVKPIALPLGDVYTSLQTGLLETVAITTSGAIAFQWHTKVKHVVDLPLSYVMGILAIDQKPFLRLTVADQQVVRDEFAAAFKALDVANLSDNDRARSVLIKQGLKFQVPDAGEIAYWRGIGDATTAKLLAAGSISAELLARIRQAQAEYRQRAAAASGSVAK